jgi:hypothetical protein
MPPLARKQFLELDLKSKDCLGRAAREHPTEPTSSNAALGHVREIGRRGMLMLYFIQNAVVRDHAINFVVA